MQHGLFSNTPECYALFQSAGICKIHCYVATPSKQDGECMKKDL